MIYSFYTKLEIGIVIVIGLILFEWDDVTIHDLTFIHPEALCCYEFRRQMTIVEVYELGINLVARRTENRVFHVLITDKLRTDILNCELKITWLPSNSSRDSNLAIGASRADLNSQASIFPPSELHLESSRRGLCQV